MAYEKTKVTVGASQGDIRKRVLAFGADRVNFGETFGDHPTVGVEFVYDDKLVRITCACEDEGDRARVWRVVHWSMKSRFEAIENGLEVFEQAFLAHVVDPATNRTIYERLKPSLDDGLLSVSGGGLAAITAAR